MSTDFPFDHPAWETATDAYRKTDAGRRLANLAVHWDAEEADDLFFSSLLHQGTVYPATFLALPHALRLVDLAPTNAHAMIASFLGGVALSAQMPSTSGGVSLVENEDWASTSLGREARDAFRSALPTIAQLCIESYRAEPDHYHASGLAAALGHLLLAELLTYGESGGVSCTSCSEYHEWMIIGRRVAIYRDEYSLEDWKSCRPDHASAIIEPGGMRPEARDVADQLGALDDITGAILASFGAAVPCTACGSPLSF